MSGTMLSAVATHPLVGWTDDEYSQSTLVARVAAGNEDALTQLYDTTNRMVYGLALRILGEETAAEDVMLEVYLQVWRTAESFDPTRGKVASWLVSMTRSRAIDLLRSRRAHRMSVEQSLDEIPDPHEGGTSLEQLAIQTSQSAFIQKSLTELPADQRRAIELAYFSGLSHSEIAAHTGLPLGTVKTRIRLGMVRLRELLAPYVEGL
jgi:RNA polymerase sigma-70 factor, ECF subfamily